MMETREEAARRMMRGVIPQRDRGVGIGWVFAAGLMMGVLVGYFGGAWYDEARMERQAERAMEMIGRLPQ